MEIYKDFGGVLFSGLALVGTTGYITPDLVSGVIIGYALIIICSMLLWRILVTKKIDIYFLAIFGAIYAIISITNFLKATNLSLSIGLCYFIFSVISVKQAMIEIADEEN